MRILITGPHSCGKTTLANELVQRWDELFPESTSPAFITEVARRVMQRDGYTRNDVNKLEFQRAILSSQVDVESSTPQPYISDRCLLDPIAYTLQKNPGLSYSNFRKLASEPSIQPLLASYRDISETLVILLQPVPEFEHDDGTRALVGSMEEWMDFFKCFLVVLAAMGIRRWKILGPETVDLGRRVEKVKGWVREMQN